VSLENSFCNILINMRKVFVKSVEDLEKWLDKNWSQQESIWLVHYKFASKLSNLTRDNLVDTLLCYGWIDSVPGKVDEVRTKIRISPRRPKSIWSKINVGKVKRLIRERKMKDSGLKLVMEAKKDGRWQKAYDSQKNMKVPEDFLKALSKKENVDAVKFYKTLNKTNLFAIGFRLSQVTDLSKRGAQINKILTQLKNAVPFHNYEKK